MSEFLVVRHLRRIWKILSFICIIFASCNYDVKFEKISIEAKNEQVKLTFRINEIYRSDTAEREYFLYNLSQRLKKVCDSVGADFKTNFSYDTTVAQYEFEFETFDIANNFFRNWNSQTPNRRGGLNMDFKSGKEKLFITLIFDASLFAVSNNIRIETENPGLEISTGSNNLKRVSLDKHKGEFEVKIPNLPPPNTTRIDISYNRENLVLLFWSSINWVEKITLICVIIGTIWPIYLFLRKK